MRTAARECLAPDEPYSACIRPKRTAARLAALSREGILSSRLLAFFRRHAHSIVRPSLAPYEALQAALGHFRTDANCGLISCWVERYHCNLYGIRTHYLRRCLVCTGEVAL